MPDLETRKMLAEADGVIAGIHKDVASLKAETGQILEDADTFLAQTKKGNAKLRTQAHQTLVDAAATMKGLAQASRERAAGWQDVLRTVQGNGSGRRAAPARKSPAGARASRPKPKAKVARSQAGVKKR